MVELNKSNLRRKGDIRYAKKKYTETTSGKEIEA